MKKITPFLPAIILAVFFLLCVNSYCDESYITAHNTKSAAEYRDKGLSAQRMGDLDTALVYYQKAMELDPTLAVVYNDAGIIYESKGWDNRAKQAYGKAIELDPSLVGPYYNLGLIYEKEGDLEKAIQYFKKRVLIGGWNDEWTMKARRELKSLGVNDPELKADFLDQHFANVEDLGGPITGSPKGNDLDPKKRKRNARLHLLRGRQLYYMGMYQEALTELGLASILDPHNKEIQKSLEEVQHQILTAR